MATKQRLALPPNSAVHGGPVLPKVQVLENAPGPITLLDKLKGYYKGIITAITAILVIANEVTPVLNFLPGQDKHYYTVAVVAIGTVLTILKDNEHWVDDL